MKALIFLIFSLFTAISAISQIKVTAPDGRIVLLYSDKKWAYEHNFSKSDYNLFECSELISISQGITPDRNIIADKGLMFANDTINKKMIYITLERFLEEPFSFNISCTNVCIKDNDSITIYFNDRSLIKLENDFKSNCDGKFKLYFNVNQFNDSVLKLLLNKEIDKIILDTVEIMLQVYFSPIQRSNFHKVINCVSENL